MTVDNKPESGAVKTTAEPLRDYEQLKFFLAAVVRDALATKPGDKADRELRTIQSRLGEDQFNLAVVGAFNRGKSSLMNAVMGIDRLPTGVVPLTSVITSVRYGSHEGAIVEFEHGGLPAKIEFEELAQYVTQQGNPGNEKRVKTVEVQLPAEILRRGFRFVDTPGLGSAIQENTATTERFLPEADAIVFVTSCDSGLGQMEVEYLRAARRLVRNLFLVINKLDLVSEAQRQQIEEFVRGRVREEVLGDVQLFLVSARQGLQAKLSLDEELLRVSRLQEFERALVEFLVTEKSRELLLRNCDRLQQVLRSMGATKLETDVEAIRQTIGGGEVRTSTAQSSLAAEAAGIRLMCPVCHAAGAQVWDFLSKFQYNISHDRDVQRHHAEHGGFCPLHTWQYEAVASPSGASGGYHPVLVQVSDQLRNVPGDELKRLVAQLQPSPHECPACQIQLRAEEETVQKIVELGNRFNGVVCLRHLKSVVEKLPSSHAELLARRCAAALERLAEDMQRFVLKSDGLHRNLISEEERRAYRVALELLGGIKRLASPPQPETYLG